MKVILKLLSIDRWVGLAIGVALLALLPLLTLLYLAVDIDPALWRHLLDTVFWVYLKNTLLLCLGVAFFTCLIGTLSAWLVTRYRFWGQGWFSWGLLLPMAVPSYILAFVITDQLEYAGWLQTALRSLFGWRSARDYWFPEIRSLWGAITVLSLVLYPYVYLLARSAFVEQAAQLFEVSRSLGKNQWQSFIQVALPLARPAIVVGITLALMETLNEYGTVAFFAVPTLSAGIFDVWINMSSLAGAAQLALLLLLLALVLLTLERRSRNAGKAYLLGGAKRSLKPESLLGWRGALASAFCLLPILLGFLLPVGVLANYALRHVSDDLSAYWLTAWNSLQLALAAALLTTLLGLLLAYGRRLSASPFMRYLAEWASLGYAIPGAVLAVGIMYPLGLFDNTLDSLSRAWFDYPLGLVFTGTTAALVLAYALRFLALSYRSLDAGLNKITPEMDDASRSLGKTRGQTLWRIHLPLLRPSLFTAALLVFVDTMKELPITLILRPFNFDTLATQVWDQASLEQLEQSALAAITILFVGIIPVIFLSRNIRQGGAQ